MNPSDGFPAFSLASFSSAITLAQVGVDALVPSTKNSWSAIHVKKFTDCAEISGNPRPEVLNSPAFVLPIWLKYCCTAPSWYDGRAKMFEKPPEEKDAATSGATP